MFEMWQLEEVRYMEAEKQTDKILSECPECEQCGEHVDIYGVEGAKYYYTMDGMFFCEDCFKKWLENNPDFAVDLAMEYADKHLLKMPKEYRGD